MTPFVPMQRVSLTRVRLTQSQLSDTRALTLRHFAVDQQQRLDDSTLTGGVVGWVQYVASRHDVPVSVVLRGGKRALERDIALALVDAAVSMAQRAMTNKEAPEGADMLHQLARKIYDRLYAVERKKLEAEQREQMAELKELIKARQGT